MADIKTAPKGSYIRLYDVTGIDSLVEGCSLDYFDFMPTRGELSLQRGLASSDHLPHAGSLDELDGIYVSGQDQYRKSFDRKVVSRIHASIRWSPKQPRPMLTDQGSTHGTYLAHLGDFVSLTSVPSLLKSMHDWQQVNQSVVLKDGDVIRLGKEVRRGDDEFTPLLLFVEVVVMQDSTQVAEGTGWLGCDAFSVDSSLSGRSYEEDEDMDYDGHAAWKAKIASDRDSNVARAFVIDGETKAAPTSTAATVVNGGGEEGINLISDDESISEGLGLSEEDSEDEGCEMSSAAPSEQGISESEDESGGYGQEGGSGRESSDDEGEEDDGRQGAARAKGEEQAKTGPGEQLNAESDGQVEAEIQVDKAVPMEGVVADSEGIDQTTDGCQVVLAVQDEDVTAEDDGEEASSVAQEATPSGQATTVVLQEEAAVVGDRAAGPVAEQQPSKGISAANTAEKSVTTLAIKKRGIEEVEETGHGREAPRATAAAAAATTPSFKKAKTAAFGAGVAAGFVAGIVGTFVGLCSFALDDRILQ